MNTKPKNNEEIEVAPPRNEGEKSSGQTVIQETPEYERTPCMTHESTIEAIIGIAREVIKTLGTTAKTSKQQAIQKLCDMVTHLEEVQMETEAMEEQMRDRMDERMERMENDMKEIKTMITNNAKTWAQVAAMNTTNTASHMHKSNESRDNNAQQATQAKQVKQQAKNEITLSIENTHEESKKELINMTSSEITK